MYLLIRYCKLFKTELKTIIQIKSYNIPLANLCHFGFFQFVMPKMHGKIKNLKHSLILQKPYLNYKLIRVAGRHPLRNLSPNPLPL